MGFFRRSEDTQAVPAHFRQIAIGTKVEIVGEPGIYLVVRIDSKRYLADLMLMGHRSKVELGVHFRSLRVLPDPKAASTPDVEAPEDLAVE